MPLIQGFRATTKFRAFTLNALVSAILIVMTIQVKSSLDKYFDKDKHKHLPKIHTSFRSLTLTFLVSFGTAFLSYWLMSIAFGFGGGMLVSEDSKVITN